jgi:hypothetical protein
MRYILDRDLDKPAFRRTLKTLRNPKLSKNAMSLAEQFRQEGIRKGRQQGRQEGHQEGLIFSQQQAILEALEIRFQRVPEGLREEIEAIIDTKKLTHLHRANSWRVNLRLDPRPHRPPPRRLVPITTRASTQSFARNAALRLKFGTPRAWRSLPRDHEDAALRLKLGSCEDDEPNVTP